MSIRSNETNFRENELRYIHLISDEYIDIHTMNRNFMSLIIGVAHALNNWVYCASFVTMKVFDIVVTCFPNPERF